MNWRILSPLKHRHTTDSNTWGNPCQIEVLADTRPYAAGTGRRTVPDMATTTHTPQQAVLQFREAPEIWSIHEIANFYRRSLRQASRIVRDASFPRPIRGDRGRWVAADVIAFAVSSDHGDESRLRHDKANSRIHRIPRSVPVVSKGTAA